MTTGHEHTGGAGVYFFIKIEKKLKREKKAEEEKKRPEAQIVRPVV